MPISGLCFGAKILPLVEFPAAHPLTGAATLDEIQAMRDRYGKRVVMPFFTGVGEKGQAGLVRIVDNLREQPHPDETDREPYLPVACDLRAAFDQDNHNPAWDWLGLRGALF